MDLELRMRAERTPNPNSVKWVLSIPVLNESDGTHRASFEKAVGSEISPLAARLFAIDGVRRVFLGSDFVTVSKDSSQDAREWSELAPDIVESIRGWVQLSEPALGEAYEAPAPLETDEIVAQINAILDSEIRPYVAQDGGDVTFVDFSDGVVRVQLRGACEGCPSSSVTLKLAIEARLKEEVAAVQRVIEV